MAKFTDDQIKQLATLSQAVVDAQAADDSAQAAVTAAQGTVNTAQAALTTAQAGLATAQQQSDNTDVAVVTAVNALLSYGQSLVNPSPAQSGN